MGKQIKNVMIVKLQKKIQKLIELRIQEFINLKIEKIYKFTNFQKERKVSDRQDSNYYILFLFSHFIWSFWFKSRIARVLTSCTLVRILVLNFSMMKIFYGKKKCSSPVFFITTRIDSSFFRCSFQIVFSPTEFVRVYPCCHWSLYSLSCDSWLSHLTFPHCRLDILLILCNKLVNLLQRINSSSMSWSKFCSWKLIVVMIWMIQSSVILYSFSVIRVL